MLVILSSLARSRFALVFLGLFAQACAPSHPATTALAAPPRSLPFAAGSPDLRADTSTPAPRPEPIALEAPASHPPSPLPDPPPAVSGLLLSGFHNPMPGGVLAGYRADTGLDIAGSPRPVFALAAGTLDYAEPGHTLWVGKHDTANTVRLRLDAPIAYKGRSVTHLWYAHLSALAVHQAEGAVLRRHIAAGELLGTSGIANGSPHLHVGMLLDGDVSQYWGTFLLEDQVREVLGGLRRGQRLPEERADRREARR